MAIPQNIEQGEIREPFLDAQTTIEYLYHHPFRAQYGYEEWAGRANTLASHAQTDVLMPAERDGVITSDDEKIYGYYSMPILRAFSEYGYNSRVMTTAVVTADTIWSLLGSTLDHESLDEIREAPFLVRGCLLKLAKQAFVWGRTGDPYAGVTFGEESDAAESPEPRTTIFREDIEDFAGDLSKAVTERAMREVKAQAGILGRMALRRRHGKKAFPGYKSHMSESDYLEFDLGRIASRKARDFLHGKDS